MNGLKGFPEAIETVFPKTEVQLYIVHLVRHSLNYVGWKQRKEVARALKLIYTSATEAEGRLAEFGAKWDTTFPTTHFFLHTAQSLLLEAIARELGQPVSKPHYK